MNYLNLVNSVLRRLRESEVTTVQGSGNNNSYARLIGDFVNEAKESIEDAWDWSVLKQTITVNTVASTTAYTLTDSKHRFIVEYAYNDTDNSTLSEMSYTQWIESTSLSEPQVGTVSHFAYDGIDYASDNVKIQVYPVPNSVQALKFFGTVRPSRLSADSDTLLIPSRPVILLATAMAQEERGEDAGQQSINAYRLAQSAMADAIALDASRQPNKTQWYES
jgi:hypothetical protein